MGLGAPVMGSNLGVAKDSSGFRHIMVIYHIGSFERPWGKISRNRIFLPYRPELFYRV